MRFDSNVKSLLKKGGKSNEILLKIKIWLVDQTFIFQVVGRFDGRNVSEGPEKKQCPSQMCLIIIVM